MAGNCHCIGRFWITRLVNERAGKVLHAHLESDWESIHCSRGTLSLYPSSRLSRLDPDLVRRRRFDAKLDCSIDCVVCYVWRLYLPNSKRREDAYLHECRLRGLSKADVEIDSTNLLILGS